MKRYYSLLILLFSITFYSFNANAQYLVDFEGETEVKPSYASATVNLSGIDWDMTEALIGNSDPDWKVGLKSARLRGYAATSVTMLGDKSGGIGSISFSYRRYGTDAQVDWKVEYSIDGGVTWTQVGTSFTAPASDEVQQFSETVNLAGSGRIRIKRATETGAANRRLNVDEISITNNSGGGNIPPTVANIVRNPAGEINSSTSVGVSASVTDTDGTIALVELRYGTVSGTYPNTIPMQLTSGSTYTTSANIPAKPDGTTVYYVVFAQDNAGGTKLSAQQSYVVRDPATTTLPYAEDFEIGLGKVYPYSLSGPDKYWQHSTGGYAFMNGFDTGLLEDDWLVLPAFNKSLYENVVLTFDTWKRFGSEDDNNYLKLYYSSNYVGFGSPSSATWTELSFAKPTEEEVWLTSGPVDLNAITGNKVYVAIRYHYNPTFYRSWQVDNVNITGDLISGNVPVKLVFTDVNNGASATVNVPFSATIQAVDAGNLAANVSVNTTVTVAVANGTGALTGTVTGVIASGTNTLILNNLKYNTAQNGVQLSATATAGMTLQPATSAPFNVLAVATNLAFVSFPNYGQNGQPIATFTVEARRADQAVDVNYTGNITLTKLTGTGSVSGTLVKPAVGGVATFNDISFNATGSYTLQATAPGLSSANSQAVLIMNPPQISTTLLPAYIVGSVPNNYRVPYAFRATLSNLIPNATYKFINQVVISGDAPTVNGAGNIIFINAAGNFYRSSSPSFTTPENHGEFTSDANGSYTGWFISEPTGNARFTPGNYVFMRIRINNGQGSTTAQNYFTTTDSTLAIGMAATADNLSGSGVYGKLFSQAKNFAVLYDNINGTGRPLAATFIEDDGTTGAAAYPPFYQNLVDGQASSWGSIIPNTLPNGLRRVEVRQLSNGAVIPSETTISANGLWPYGKNTVNPTAGPDALLITKSPDFTANTTNITPGSQVQFTDLTLGQPTAWAWAFQGGTPATSTAQNPNVTYSTAGEFDVALTVTTPFGTHTVTKTEFITVTSSATANFTATPLTPAVGTSVTFTNTSTGQINTYQWTFEGGTPATFNGQTPPAIAYNTAGTFDVSLTVTNDIGSNTKTKPDYITAGFPPVANFIANGNTLIEVGNTVSFTDQSTGNIDTWIWAFEGGFPANSLLQNPGEIFYNNAGSFDVSLTVSNDFGSNTKNMTDFIQAGFAPVADFTSSFTAFLDRLEYHFTDVSTNSPTAWSWVLNGGNPSTSTAQNPIVNYSVDGTYNVTLTATNQFGNGTVIKTGYVVVNLTDINENITVLGLTLVPNPAKGKVLISDIKPGTTLRVRDLTGRVIFERELENDSYLLETGTFAKGLLLIEASHPDFKKVVVTKLINQ